jgi:hypothetical protein
MTHRFSGSQPDQQIFAAERQKTQPPTDKETKGRAACTQGPCSRQYHTHPGSGRHYIADVVRCVGVSLRSRSLTP